MASKKPITYFINNRGCYICTSHSKNSKGYPRYMNRGKYTSMSRYIYELCVGRIKNGLHIRHECDNSSCINPNHLLVGSNADNVRDCIERRRHCHGEDMYFSKLTEEQVNLVRKGGSPRALGRKYGVAHTTIIRIQQGKAWKYLLNKI